MNGLQAFVRFSSITTSPSALGRVLFCTTQATVKLHKPQKKFQITQKQSQKNCSWVYKKIPQQNFFKWFYFFNGYNIAKKDTTKLTTIFFTVFKETNMKNQSQNEPSEQNPQKPKNNP